MVLYAPLFLYLVSATSSSPYVFGASDLVTGISNGGVVSSSITFTPVSATPLPPTWTMMLIGLAGFGLAAYRRKSKPALMVA